MKSKQKIFQITHDVEYVKNQLNVLANKHHINSYTIMRIIGHTGSETAMRYRQGETEPKPSQLANLCSHLNLNLLDFFIYNKDYHFKSDIDDIYRMEQLGITAGDVLKEYGINPIDRVNDSCLTPEDAVRFIEKRDKEIENASTNKRNDASSLRQEIEDFRSFLEQSRTIPTIQRYEQRIEQLMTISSDQQKTIQFLREQLSQANILISGNTENK